MTQERADLTLAAYGRERSTDPGAERNYGDALGAGQGDVPERGGDALGDFELRWLTDPHRARVVDEEVDGQILLGNVQPEDELF